MTLNRTTTPVTLAPKRGIYTLEKMLPALRLAAKQRRQILETSPGLTAARLPTVHADARNPVFSRVFPTCPTPPITRATREGEISVAAHAARERGERVETEARRGPTQGREPLFPR